LHSSGARALRFWIARRAALYTFKIDDSTASSRRQMRRCAARAAPLIAHARNGAEEWGADRVWARARGAIGDGQE
jgi:hypothetical protein